MVMKTKHLSVLMGAMLAVLLGSNAMAITLE